MWTAVKHKIMNSILARGLEAGKPLPLTEELMIVYGFWGRSDQFSLRVWPLVSWPHSNGNSIPRSIWTVQIRPGGLSSERGHSIGRSGLNLGELRGGMGEIGLNNIVWNSHRIKNKYFFDCMFEDSVRSGLWRVAIWLGLPREMQQDVGFAAI